MPRCQGHGRASGASLGWQVSVGVFQPKAGSGDSRGGSGKVRQDFAFQPNEVEDLRMGWGSNKVTRPRECYGRDSNVFSSAHCLVFLQTQQLR